MKAALSGPEKITLGLLFAYFLILAAVVFALTGCSTSKAADIPTMTCEPMMIGGSLGKVCNDDVARCYLFSGNNFSCVKL